MTSAVVVLLAGGAIALAVYGLIEHNWKNAVAWAVVLVALALLIGVLSPLV